MRNNTLVMLGASIAFGALAVILARSWISSAIESEFTAAEPRITLPALQARAPATQPLLVAAHDIAFGDELTTENFRTVDYPENSVPLGTFADVDALFAQASPEAPLRALADIRALEPVFADRVSGAGAKLALSARIADGFVATGVPVDPVSGVGGHVVPGDRVDVMHVTQPDPKDKPELFQSRILIQAVRVLGVDQNASPATEEAEIARTVTLEVDRRDLQVLALAVETGTLSLALRSAGATEFVTTPGLRSDQLSVAERTAAPRPRKPRRTRSADDGRTSVKVVRGDTVQSVRVRRRAEPVQSASNTDTLAGGLQP